MVELILFIFTANKWPSGEFEDIEYRLLLLLDRHHSNMTGFHYRCGDNRQTCLSQHRFDPGYGEERQMLSQREK